MQGDNNKKLTRCDICNSILFEDGTVEDCGGECGRTINVEQDYVPLRFDEEDVVRELPEPFPYDEREDEGVYNDA